MILFVGLLCLIGPVLFGREAHWASWLWLIVAGGLLIVWMFLRYERGVARRGGMPLIDLDLLADPAFVRGLGAVFCFFFANLSFYLVTTLYMQATLRIVPLWAGLVFMPLALAFVIASRHSGARAKRRGTLVLIEGCVLQIIGLAALASTVAAIASPAPVVLATVMIVFGYGQGLVMAPLSGAVLSHVRAGSAGSGSGLYGTTTQIASASGVAAIGAVYFAVAGAGSARPALQVALGLIALSLVGSIVLLHRMRRAVAIQAATSSAR